LKVSLIIVTHPKYGKYLPKALQSIRQQTSKDFETILVANGWPDIVADVHCDGTLAHACNRGIEAAVGEYIVRIDSDDWIEPQLIEYELEEIQKRQVDAVWCDYWRTTEHKGEGYSVHYLDPHPNRELEHACGVMFKRSCWEELGGYRENLKYQESFDFWGRFQDRFRAERLPLPLYYYRKHDSMSSNIIERNAVRARILKEENEA
jgi:glycosyltransferase involved in cell wall biosynthesis